MANGKYVLKVTLTLTLVTGAAALVLGGVNALTAPKIEQNAKDALTKKLKVPFGNDVDIDSEHPIDLSGKITNYVKAAYPATQNGTSVGTLFQTSGTNAYGSVTLLIGVYSDGSLTPMSILEDTETYKAKLEPNYVDVYNAAKKEDREQALEKVQCGATFGARLIRDMVKEAQNLATGKGESLTADVSEEGLTCFGASADHYKAVDLSAYVLSYVKKGYSASLGSFEEADQVGSLFYVESRLSADATEDAKYYVAVGKDGALGTMAFEHGVTPSAEASSFLTSYNAATDKSAYLDSIVAGVSDTVVYGGATFPAKEGEESETGSSSESLVLKAGILEAQSIFLGTAEMDSRFSCFESGEVDSFADVAGATGTYIQKISSASKDSNLVAYVYDLKGKSEKYDTPLEVTFAVYANGDYGKIAVVENGQTYGTDKLLNKSIEAFNALDRAKRKDSLDFAKSGSTYGGELLVKMIAEAAKDAATR